jgi:hypothetical protein
MGLQGEEYVQEFHEQYQVRVYSQELQHFEDIEYYKIHEMQNFQKIIFDLKFHELV